jgi:hypothetical protein
MRKVSDLIGPLLTFFAVVAAAAEAERPRIPFGRLPIPLWWIAERQFL